MKNKASQKGNLIIKFKWLIAFLCITNNLFSQIDNKELLRKAIHKIDSLNNFKCLSKRMFGDRNSLSYSYFYKNDKDTSVGYSFVLDNDFSAKTIYNQNNLLVINLQLKNFQSINLTSDPYALVLLKSMFSSPITIKNLLKECLASNNIKYNLFINSSGRYQFTTTFPNWVRDGYKFDIMTTNEKMQTTINVIFDTYSFLPVSYEKKITSANQTMAFVDSFYNYKSIMNTEINIMDSIPAGFNSAKEKTVKSESIGKMTPNFKLKSITGDSLELKNINKYVLLEFTSLRCGACISATKYLVNNFDRFPNNLIEIIAIDIENKSQVDKLSQYINVEKIKYPYLINGNDIFSTYKGFATPTFVLINKEKFISDIMIGFDSNKIDEIMGTIK